MSRRLLVGTCVNGSTRCPLSSTFYPAKPQPKGTGFRYSRFGGDLDGGGGGWEVVGGGGEVVGGGEEEGI